MSNKIVLITGASSGIGKATAKLLSQKGYVVYGAARQTKKMEDIQRLGVKLLNIDVTRDEEMISGVDTIIKNEGRIDILINNAGFGLLGSIEDVSMDDARRQLEVNLIGTARLTQLVLPNMRKQKSGKIVNISSIGGKISLPVSGWYNASKFAIEGLSDSLRMEVEQFGINVILIEPGSIKSDFFITAKEYLDKIPDDSVYAEMVAGFNESVKKSDKISSDPSVISKLILKAISARKPKTRYHGGSLSNMVLFMRSVLPDRMFYGILMKQIK